MPLFSRVAALTSVSMFMGATAKAMMEGPKVEAHEAIYDPKKKTSFKINFEPYVLGEKLMLAEDVALLRFLLHNPDDVFDLKPCSTLQSRHSTGGNRIEQVQRAYTPITPFGTKGYFDIIVKKQHHGRMTEHLFSMEPGEKLEFRVAVHKLHYVPNRWKYMGAIAGGTGISSVLQVIREVCDNPEDKTKVSLLFGNRAESKILIRSIIDGLATKHADKFKVHYCIDSTDETNKNTWKGFVGHINKEMIAKTMPPPHKENLILVCGPDSMMQSVVGLSAATLKAMSGGLPHQPLGSGINNMNTTIEGYLGELGYLGEYVYRF